MRHNITSRVAAPSLMAVLSADDYAHGIEAAGGLPVVLPYASESATVNAWSEQLDGLVLGGGEDVNPFLFGEEPKNGIGTIVPERDELEIQLVHYMVQLKKPVFGICRGMQVLNVAFGGTLYQDLSRQWSGMVAHRQRAARNYLSHHVVVQPGSRLSRLMHDKTEIACNSFHHQAVRDLAEGWTATAWDEDGLVEAMEHDGHPYLLAVQWHPENLWRDYPEYLALFRGLVEAAGA